MNINIAIAEAHQSVAGHLLAMLLKILENSDMNEFTDITEQHEEDFITLGGEVFQYDSVAMLPNGVIFGFCSSLLHSAVFIMNSNRRTVYSISIKDKDVISCNISIVSFKESNLIPLTIQYN